MKGWDYSHITDFGCLFAQETKLVRVPHLETSHVDNMEFMFSGCLKFEGGCETWDVSNVRGFAGTFLGCRAFNADISKWNTREAISMHKMFCRCSNFNQDLSNWNVSKVKDMELMFSECHFFNQDLSRWDVSNVRSISGMFLPRISEVITIEETYRDRDTYGEFSAEDALELEQSCFLRHPFPKKKSFFDQDLSEWQLKDGCEVDDAFFSGKQYIKAFGAENAARMTAKSGRLDPFAAKAVEKGNPREEDLAAIIDDKLCDYANAIKGHSHGSIKKWLEEHDWPDYNEWRDKK